MPLERHENADRDQRERSRHDDDGFAPSAPETLGEGDHGAADGDDADDATGRVEPTHRVGSVGCLGWRVGWRVGHQSGDDHRRDDEQREREREHPPPPERVDEHTTEERAAGRRDRRAARPQADRPATLFLGEAGIDEGEADRGHAGGADALDQATGDEHPEVGAARQITEPTMSAAQLAT